jgi:hypothetical protein
MRTSWFPSLISQRSSFLFALRLTTGGVAAWNHPDPSGLNVAHPHARAEATLASAAFFAAILPTLSACSSFGAFANSRSAA